MTRGWLAQVYTHRVVCMLDQWQVAGPTVYVRMCTRRYSVECTCVPVALTFSQWLNSRIIFDFYTDVTRESSAPIIAGLLTRYSSFLIYAVYMYICV